MHLIMLLSFFVLALTGMSLKFSQAGWAKFLMGLMGGTENAGWRILFSVNVTCTGWPSALVAEVWIGEP